MSENDRQALLEEINKHEWYQRISLGDGVVTPGEIDDTSEKKLEMMNLPENMQGKSVLDIGCNEGFFAFEVERRGAAPILAIDASNRAEKKFELVKRALDSKIQFERTDLMDITPEKHGTFDLIFFLAVYHHVRHPFAVIDHLARLTSCEIIMEIVEATGEPEGLSALVRRKSVSGRLQMLPTRTLLLELLARAEFTDIEILGEHRQHLPKEKRKMSGFGQRRVMLKARH